MNRLPGRRAATLVTSALIVLPFAASGAEPGSVSTPLRTAAEWYAMGGWIMHVLAGCSMAVLAISLERAWALRPGALRALGTRVGAAIDAVRGKAKPVRAEALERTCALESATMRENLNLLSALASLATMLGLLGTVLGMVDAFDRIAVAGTGDARIVADGIFRALVTTAAGLSVAVAATAIHALLRRRVEHAELELARRCSEAIEGDEAESVPGARAEESGELRVAVSPS